MSTLMRAFVMTGYGGPDVTEIRDMVIPVAGPGEVAVMVRAVGLNPVDYKIREGQLRPVLRFRMPAIMGNELAGTVEAVGEGVTDLSIGDRIFVRVPKDRMGALAEVAVTPAKDCAILPDALGFEEAAAVPLAGLTSLQALRDELDLQPGQHVFISAGAGGVGSFAIPIAKWLGAKVTTTASSRGRELVKALGADRVIDYENDRFEHVLEKVDAAFDLIGGDTLSRTFGVVKEGGKVVSIAGTPEPETAKRDMDGSFGLSALFWIASLKLRMQAARHGVDYRFLFMHPDGPGLADLARLIEDGTIDPVVDRTFPFDETADAMAYLEKGHAKGKVVVTM